MCCSLKVWPWNRDAPLGWCVSKQPTASRISMPSEQRWLGLWLMILERNAIGIFGRVSSASAVEKSSKRRFVSALGAVINGHNFHFPTGNAPEIGGGVRSFLAEETWWIQVHLIRWKLSSCFTTEAWRRVQRCLWLYVSRIRKDAEINLEKCKDMHRHAEHILDQILGSAFQVFLLQTCGDCYYQPDLCPKWSEIFALSDPLALPTWATRPVRWKENRLKFRPATAVGSSPDTTVNWPPWIHEAPFTSDL